ncbi:spore maturation protein [Pelotomaculum terephthalicicum JT]|uniref:spore maturation protein n=1 Tax=Pelotomaculum TaxID=191373 RepID=UPI0009C45C70|nr:MULTISPECIES: spore maturation protein [Pelotomaculum]MCG9968127.1 spore maturation protein [Pelotomaculum terephthalicicum JT]OPX83976.1 MAG: Spore maturation protein B [Pelotomaculum sp. PtaB.Bin117]OPY62915.1 MAG: Spore maturation protein B [Pelotomaculum sp. PtaU1.Bin065]
MLDIISELSRWAIPVILLVVPLIAALRRVKVYEAFVDGAEAGFTTAIKTIPYLVAMLVAIGIFRASGAMEVLVATLSPVLNIVGLPTEVLPHAIMRPLSGGAALGIASDIIKTYGPDSFLGRLVSTMQGSCDTTFYVLTLYFGSVGVRKYRYSVVLGLISDLTTLVASVFIVRTFF